MKKTIGLAALVLLTASAGCSRDEPRGANADGTPASPVGTAGKIDVSRADRDFVHDTAIAAMGDIQLGKMAAERGTTPDVKKFGQMMVDDHTAAGDKLKAIATDYSVELPTELDDKHRDLGDSLSKETGAEFDRKYMAAMVDGHEGFIDKLESRIDQAKLGEWKARYEDRLAGKKSEERIEAGTVMPERSDNPVTMRINQWAADVYPTAYAHLATAKGLNDKLKKRTTP
jgi:putative membrane protein